MATYRTLGTLLSTFAVTTLIGCGSDLSAGGPGEPSGPVKPVPSGTPSQGSAKLAYPGHGFIVHEWGTNTIVVGSDGSLQRGLHHEEEDLPSFVYDRIKAGAVSDVTAKMETPVTYFYSDTPRSVTVSVDFPKGVFSQWYPQVQRFGPEVFVRPGADGFTYVDPVLDPSVKFTTPECKAQYSAVSLGQLDWGQIDVLARDAVPAAPEASLDKFTWSYARDVAANPLRAHTNINYPDVPEEERFLFYRGLGNLEFPLQVGALPGGKIAISNPSKMAMGRLFVINVANGKGAFSVKDAGIAGGEVFEPAIPSLDGAAELPAYADALAIEVTKALDATGLYHDEAESMVSTWKRQWFKTPGVRVLYLMPQEWTDAAIPLTITPAPEEMRRVMMIRVEVITPELEQIDAAKAKLLAQPTTESKGRLHFDELGRFAEPRLRRALAIVGDPSLGQEYLAWLTSAETRVSVGE